MNFLTMGFHSNSKLNLLNFDCADGIYHRESQTVTYITPGTDNILKQRYSIKANVYDP